MLTYLNMISKIFDIVLDLNLILNKVSNQLEDVSHVMKFHSTVLNKLGHTFSLVDHKERNSYKMICSYVNKLAGCRYY